MTNQGMLEPGQVWRSTLVPDASQIELLTVGKTWVSYQHPVLRLGVNVRTVEEIRAWIARYGAVLLPDPPVS